MLNLDEMKAILSVIGMTEVCSGDDKLVVSCAKACNKLSAGVARQEEITKFTEYTLQDLFAYIDFTGILWPEMGENYIEIERPMYEGYPGQGIFRITAHKTEKLFFITATKWWSDVIEEQLGCQGEEPHSPISSWIRLPMSDIIRVIDGIVKGLEPIEG